MPLQTKTISVIGATGQQGGAVSRSILQNPRFTVRCITRNPASEKAKALRNLGLEVVQADGADEVGMTAALRGSFGLFFNLNNEAYDDQEALQLGINIIASARNAGIKHLVFSSAPYISKLLSQQVASKSFDVKAKIELLAGAEPAFETFTPVMAGWYMETISEETAYLFGGFPKGYRYQGDGPMECTLPLWGEGGGEMPWISILDDFGDIVHGIFLQPVRWNRRVIQCTSDILSCGDMVAAFSSVTRKKASYVPIPRVEDKEQGDIDPMAFEETRNMFSYIQLRGGEYFPDGITELRTAAELKRAACQQKKGNCRETLITVREYIEREFMKHPVQDD